MKYIIQKPNFSSGTTSGNENEIKESFLLDEGDRNIIMEFLDGAAAQKHIDGLDSGIYYLRHGEMGRPSYRIVDAEEEGGGGVK